MRGRSWKLSVLDTPFVYKWNNFYLFFQQVIIVVSLFRCAYDIFVRGARLCFFFFVASHANVHRWQTVVPCSPPFFNNWVHESIFLMEFRIPSCFCHLLLVFLLKVCDQCLGKLFWDMPVGIDFAWLNYFMFITKRVSQKFWSSFRFQWKWMYMGKGNVELWIEEASSTPTLI